MAKYTSTSTRKHRGGKSQIIGRKGALHAKSKWILFFVILNFLSIWFLIADKFGWTLEILLLIKRLGL